MKIRELNKNPFFNTTDIDIALTSTGYVSEVALKPPQDVDDNVAAAIARYARMRRRPDGSLREYPYPIIDHPGLEDYYG